MGKGRVEIHEKNKSRYNILPRFLEENYGQRKSRNTQKINLAIIFCLDSLRKIMGKGRDEIHEKNKSRSNILPRFLEENYGQRKS